MSARLQKHWQNMNFCLETCDRCVNCYKASLSVKFHVFFIFVKQKFVMKLNKWTINDKHSRYQPIHDMAYIWHGLYMTWPIQDMAYTWHSLYMTWPIYDMDYTWHSLYMIWPIHDMAYTWCGLYNTWPIHDMAYTWHGL